MSTVRNAPIRLTAEIIEALAVGERRNDTDARGMFAERGARGVVFRLQRDLRVGPGKVSTIRLVCGRWDGTAKSLRAARAEASRLAALIREGIDPRKPAAAPADAAAPTLAILYEEYLRDAASERTARSVRYRLDRYLGGASSEPESDPWPRKLGPTGGDWRERTVAEIAPHVRARFELIRDECGQHSANRTMRDLRAVLAAAKVSPNPVDEALGKRAWRKAKDAERESRKSQAIAPGELGAWYERLCALPDDWRRRFHLVCLLSGARPSMIAELEVAWVDLDRGLIRFPARIMKVRTRGDFVLPLSDWLVAILREQIERREPRRLPGGGEASWVFPVRQRSGRVGPLRFWREKAMAHPTTGVQEVGYACRHTFAREALETPGVAYVDREILMARAIPGVGGEHYDPARGRGESLARAMQAITDRFRALLGADAPASKLAAEWSI